MIKKNVSRFGYGLTAIFYIVGFLSLIFFPAPRVEAIAPGNFAVYPGPENTPEAVNDAYANGSEGSGVLDGAPGGDDSNINYYKQSQFNTVHIKIKGHPKLKDFIVQYDQQVSNDIGVNKRTSPARDTLSGVGELFFTYKYYCSIPGNEVQLSRFSGGEQLEVTYAIGLHKVEGDGERGLAKDFVAKQNYEITAGPLEIKRTSGDGSSFEKIYHVNDYVGGNIDQVGPQHLDDHASRFRGAGVNETCVPSDYFGNTKNVRNFNKLNSAQQNAFGVAAQNPSSDPDGSVAASPDCRTAGSPLAWVICPVIDLISGFSDFVFSDIIKPLLSDVPVSTDPNDGSYKAWQNFRILGNIVLVGAMVLVVYAQLKS